MPISIDNRQMVLASGSPRRLELMRMIGFDPRVHVSAVPEIVTDGESGREYTRRLAVEKARAVRLTLNEHDPEWILAADTVVEAAGKILEKPADVAEGVAMLKSMVGTSHRVTTSFCWLNRLTAESVVQSVTATVFFRDADDDTLWRYVKTGEPMDKAGAYGAQGVGAFLIERVEGSYHAVVGLPICQVVESLTALGGLVDFPFAGM